ncbi:MAG TPA: anaerobic sulfatase maturase [Lentisphaeria bacterium]|jgi:uncharacterized protein|nr:anaerobic sulfatase maturase [Lentisphaeria bacterium]
MQSNQPFIPVTPMSKARSTFHVLAKPIGPICNLDCDYCFYLKKEKELYPGVRDFKMSDETLETFVKSYIQSQPPGITEINFAWQGGEPTLMGVDFFRRAVELQKKHLRPGQRFTNALQTNGTRLDDEWCEFLREHGFLVGISIDGPEEFHDKYRPDKGGKGSFKKVMQGLRLLQKHRVEFNTLTVVQEDNGKHPLEIYRFLRDECQSDFVQFIPIVEGVGKGMVSTRSVGKRQYGEFLVEIFEEWRKNDIGRVYVQLFEVLLGIAAGYPSSLCVHKKTCGRAVALEHNGDLYSCDHFVYPKDLVGNINKEPMGELMETDQQRKFGNDKSDALPDYCKRCEFLDYCNGGCPAHRHIETPDGDPGLNYLCEGYKVIYAHADPYLKAIARTVQLGLPPQNYEQFMPGATPAAPAKSIKSKRKKKRPGPR